MSDHEEHVTRGTGRLERFLSHQRYQMAARLIPKDRNGGKLLDIGCGRYPLFLARFPFAVKFGLDKDPHPVNPAVVSGQSLTLLTQDLESRGDLPFEAESFDVVLMLAVLEHIAPDKLPVLLKDIHRILKKEGLYVVTTPASWTDPLLTLMSRVGLLSGEEIREHKKTYDRAGLKERLHTGGFHKEDIQVGTFEWGMNLWAVAKK